MIAAFKDPLLTLASEVFDSAGYVTGPFAVDGEAQGLRAENALFVVSVVAAPTMSDLLRMNSIVSLALAQDLREGKGPKRWDGYLVLLTQEASLDVGEMTAHLYELSYDTHVVRRIVRTGVEPALSNVREILRPFLPLEQHDVSSFGDPLEALRSELTMQGVSEALATRAVNAFRATESLRDV